MNLIQRYSSTVVGAQSAFHSRFYALLVKLYQDAPAARPRITRLCSEKLHALLAPRAASLSQQLRLDELCASGAAQPPLHELLAAVALLLDEAAPSQELARSVCGAASP